MKALIVDISSPQEVKILNTRITSSITVLSGFYIPLEEGGDVYETVIQKISREKLGDIQIHLIPPREFVQSHVFHFPPLPDKEITKILPREIAAATDAADPVVYCFLNNGMVKEKQTQKLEVAAFYTDRTETFALLKRFKSAGLNITKIIPEIQGMKSFLEHNPQLVSERSAAVFLDFMDSRVNMNIFKMEHWGLQREFAFHIGHGDDLTEEDLSRISIELNRTFQYFKQKYRIYSVDKAVVYGVNPNLNHLKLFIGDNQPVTVTLVGPEHFKTKITYPANLKSKEEFVLIFTLALMVAESLTGKKVLNLFPSEFKEKEKLPRRLIGLGISTALVCGVLGAGMLWLEKIKNDYDADIGHLEKTYQSLTESSRRIDLTKRQRAAYYKKRFFAQMPVQYSFGASDFIRRLSLSAGPDIRLERLEIAPRTQSMTFILKGSIPATDNINAQSAFLRFYQELKEYDAMAEITFSTIKVNAGGKGANSLGMEEGGGDGENDKKVELFFTINGELELE